MKIQIHNGLREPQTLEVTRVVVLDQFDNPIVLAVEVDQGVILTESASNEANFNAMLRSLGINKTVLVHGVQEKRLPTIQVPGV